MEIILGLSSPKALFSYSTGYPLLSFWLCFKTLKKRIFAAIPSPSAMDYKSALITVFIKKAAFNS